MNSLLGGTSIRPKPNIDDASRKVKAWIPYLMPSSAPTEARFIAKARTIQEDFAANFRDKHLAQIDWQGSRRKTSEFCDDLVCGIFLMKRVDRALDACAH
jgi:hypothetical protein